MDTTRHIIPSHGLSLEMLLAIPSASVLAVGGVVTVAEHGSTSTMFGAAIALVAAGLLISSCAFSLWGTCSIRIEDGRWIAERVLGRWRRITSFVPSEVRTVSLVRPTGFTPFPSAGGWSIHVELRSRDRPLRIGLGMHCPPEELEPVRAMIEQTS
jgi:hypothetical protein